MSPARNSREAIIGDSVSATTPDTITAPAKVNANSRSEERRVGKERREHTRWPRDWSSDVCSSDLDGPVTERSTQQAYVSSPERVEAPIDPSGKAMFDVPGAQQPRSHHRRQRERHDARHDHGAGQGERELEIGRASCREREERAYEVAT